MSSPATSLVMKSKAALDIVRRGGRLLEDKHEKSMQFIDKRERVERGMHPTGKKPSERVAKETEVIGFMFDLDAIALEKGAHGATFDLLPKLTLETSADEVKEMVYIGTRRLIEKTAPGTPENDVVFRFFHRILELCAVSYCEGLMKRETESRCAR
jgi:hypothetical protein